MTGRSPFDDALKRAQVHALQYLSTLDRGPVAATATLEQLRRRLGRPLTDAGVDAVQVTDELVADVEGGLNRVGSGRFYGWVIGGVLPAALAADWLTSAWDQNSGLYAVAPAEAVVEEVCGTWLLELLGLPATASFALTTGCQMAHLTCLAAARNELLQRRGWDVEQKGLNAAPPVRLVTSDQRHGTVERALRLLGLGRDCVVILPADDEGRLTTKRLQAALNEDADKATIVLLQAADLNIGAFDPFSELIPLAHEHQAWVHVDGAFGLWLAASSAYRHLVRGVETADSWATDGHKWLNVPFDCGYAFVAHPRAHMASMTHRESYLTHADEVRDQLDWNPEWSRRGRGFATYAAIRQLGRRGIEEMIDRCCRCAHALVTRIGGLDGAEAVWVPTSNQGLVRFLDPRPGATEKEHDRHTDEVAVAIMKTGEAFFTNTTWRGRRCMRVSVVNWQTDDSDVDRAVATVQAILDRFPER